MIVYRATKADFIYEIENGSIEDKINLLVKQRLGRKVGKKEMTSWQNSLVHMSTIIRYDSIPDDAGIAIEYSIPRTNNRIDFIVTGHNDSGEENMVIVELKQWSYAELTNKDAIVKTELGRGLHETVHPSYQAWSYSTLLDSFNEYVYNEKVGLKPCAYLHNYASDDIILNKFYQAHLERAPLFCKEDKADLKDFIAKYIRKGDNAELIVKVDRSRIRPSKVLAENLKSLMAGNDAFVMIDTQKEVYEHAVSVTRDARPSEKQVFIVQGGPGTGKSVIAINLLSKFIQTGFLTQYVTRNSAPRVVYESKLTGTFRKTEFSNLFKSSSAYHNTKSNLFDALVVDEAHRLNAKSGMFKNLGENQIKEIINAAKCAVFFLDEDQRVTLSDIGSREEILKWAQFYNCTVHEAELISQFRCGGSDGYLTWLDNTLQLKETANPFLERDDFDFRVIDNPNELREMIIKKNLDRNSARLVAGYCWDWNSKKDANAMDIVMPEYEFEMQWNFSSDGMLWMIKPESVTEVGCIHTSQGLELDYVGVIVGDDFCVRNGHVICDVGKRSRSDKSIHGHKKMLKEQGDEARQILDTIVKNTYKTLMTRGLKGCYVFFTDDETREYFKSRLSDENKANVKPIKPYNNYNDSLSLAAEE